MIPSYIPLILRLLRSQRGLTVGIEGTRTHVFKHTCMSPVYVPLVYCMCSRICLRWHVYLCTCTHLFVSVIFSWLYSWTDSHGFVTVLFPNPMKCFAPVSKESHDKLSVALNFITKHHHQHRKRKDRDRIMTRWTEC